jgi:hypothetical protein
MFKNSEIKNYCPPKEDPSLKEKLIIENCQPEADPPSEEKFIHNS